MSCDVDSGTRDFRLDSSPLFYLWIFNLIVHTKCRKGVFCMDYEAKFRALKQAIRVKLEVTRSWNLRHNSEHVDLVISGKHRPQENRIFWFLKIHKIVFYLYRKFFSAEVHCMKYRIRWETKKVDITGTLGPVQMPNFSWAERNSNLDRPKLTKVRLLIQTSNLIRRT